MNKNKVEIAGEPEEIWKVFYHFGDWYLCTDEEYEILDEAIWEEQDYLIEYIQLYPEALTITIVQVK